MSFLAELKRRNVFRVAIAYVLLGWAVLQGADFLLDLVGAPDLIIRVFVIAGLVGLPFAIFFAWAYELTPEGIKREQDVDRSRSVASRTGKKLDRFIIGLLLLVIVLMAAERLFMVSDTGPAELSTAAQSEPVERGAEAAVPLPSAPRNSNAAPGMKSVAVLPFAVMSTGPDDDYFADGLTEEIINSLSQLPDLMVTARTSAFHFKGQNIPIGDIARQLGVSHVVEGSVRRGGSQLRITAQLIRAQDGFHLWSEIYDRRLEDTFAVQEDISHKVAEALDVVLNDARRQSMRAVGVRNVEAFLAYQKGMELYLRAHSENNQISDLRRANQHFEDAIRFYPEFSDAYSHHSDLYSHILIDHAAGELDGDVTESDLESAPANLRRDFENSIRFATSDTQRLAAEVDSALILGEWRGLSSRIERSLLAPGCETAIWIQLAAAPFGNAPLMRDAFQRSILCDPLQSRGDVHMANTLLWLGDWPATQAFVEDRLQDYQNSWLVRSLALALATQGNAEAAEELVRNQTLREDDLLFSLATLAALAGDAEASQGYQEEYLGIQGPDDESALRLEAARGNRNQANYLAAQIDAREFGHVVLMQTIYSCLCGAPFDLEATPVFAGMLADSGLDWPPPKPVPFPLKDW